MHMVKRAPAQLVGLVGGVVGVVMGAIGLLANKILPGLASFTQSETMLLFSLIGLFGAFIVTSKKRDGGLIMIVIGLAGIIALPNIVTIVPFIILLAAGIIARL